MLSVGTLRLPFVDHQQQIELLRVHQDANVLEIGRAEFLTLATLEMHDEQKPNETLIWF